MARPANILRSPLLIVCDTCIYAKDFRLINNDWTKNAAILKTHVSARVVLPKAIEQELSKKLEELGDIAIVDVDKEISAAEKRLIALNVDWGAVKKKLAEDRAGYVDRIESFTGGRLLKTPLPRVSLSACFGRAIGGKRPFKVNSSEGGYKRTVDGLRDTVIWESVKEIYKKNKTASLIFYSNNSTDFADSKTKELHPQLWSEILDIRQNGQGFFFIHDEAAGVEDLIRDFLSARPDEVLKALASPTEDYYGEHENGLVVRHHFLRSLTIQKFYEESKQALLVEAIGEFEVDAVFFMDKNEYYSMDADDITVLDADWNDHVMSVGKHDTWPVHMLASTSAKGAKNKILQITINGIQIGEDAE